MKNILAQVAAVLPLLFLHGYLALFGLLMYVLVTLGVNTANTAKVRAVENRVSTLESTAVTGDGSGDVTLSGDLHIDGTLYGTGGTLTVGDNINADNDITAQGNLICDKTTTTDFIVVNGTQWQQAGGVTPPTTTWGGGAGCSLSTGNFNANALTGLNQVEGAVNEIITALSNMGLLT